MQPKFQQNFFEDHEEQEFLDNDYLYNEQDFGEGREDCEEPVYRQVLDTANSRPPGGPPRHGWLEQQLNQGEDSGPRYQPNPPNVPGLREPWNNQELAGYSQPEFGWRPPENIIEYRGRQVPFTMQEPVPKVAVRAQLAHPESSATLDRHNRLDTDGRYLITQGN